MRAFRIAHTDGKRWRTLDSIGMPDFTEDPDEALTFTRVDHADLFAGDDPEDVRIEPFDIEPEGATSMFVIGFASGLFVAAVIHFLLSKGLL